MIIWKLLKYQKNFYYNSIIYFFLFWNAIKLFLINSDPIIQVLNLLISSGIYFCIEDKKLIIKNIRRIDFFIGIMGITFTLIRSFLLYNIDDKYYYFNLPIGIFLIIIVNPYKKFFYLKRFFLYLYYFH